MLQIADGVSVRVSMDFFLYVIMTVTCLGNRIVSVSMFIYVYLHSKVLVVITFSYCSPRTVYLITYMMFLACYNFKGCM